MGTRPLKVGIPGSYDFHHKEDENGRRAVIGIAFWCPCGCGNIDYLRVKPYGEGKPEWIWNQSKEKPTLIGSIGRHARTDEFRCNFHGYLINGRWGTDFRTLKAMA